jgi:hypothetical protein
MYQMGHDVIEAPKIEHVSTVWTAPKVFPLRRRKFFVFVHFHPSHLVRAGKCNRSLCYKWAAVRRLEWEESRSPGRILHAFTIAGLPTCRVLVDTALYDEPRGARNLFCTRVWLIALPFCHGFLPAFPTALPSLASASYLSLSVYVSSPQPPKLVDEASRKMENTSAFHPAGSVVHITSEVMWWLII